MVKGQRQQRRLELLFTFYIMRKVSSLISFPKYEKKLAILADYFTREEELSLDSDNDEVSCQASSDATAPLSSETSRTVLDLFTGLPLAGWLLYPVPALKPEVSVPACSPSFQGPFCPIIRKQYLLLAVLGVLYSAYRQGLYLASFIPGDESNMKSNRITSHLSIYKPQLTSTFPIYHRISGGFPIFRSD